MEKPVDNQAVQPGARREAEIKAEALQADVTRRKDIAAQFAPFADKDGVVALQRACEDDTTVTALVAGQKLLAHIAKGASSVAGSVVTIEDEADKRRGAQVQALMARAGLGKQDTANPYRGYTLMELARASAGRSGLGEGDKREVVASAFTHSTSDFPLLLEDVARRSLKQGYEEAAETFQLWTRPGTLTDFREAKRISVGSFGDLDKVDEGAEYKYGTMGEHGQRVVLATYGKLFSITRQAIINDDLNAFTTTPRAFGRSAIRTVGNMVYATLTGAPIMDETGKQLFHAEHSNLLAAAGINTDSVEAMQAAMALQTTKDGEATNIAMKYLLVPVSLRGTANVVRASEYSVGAAAKNNTIPNVVRDTFEVIADARLDRVSKTAWYGAADQNLFDTIEVNYLDGNQTPYLEQKQGWNVDGTEFKVRLDAGVSPLDFRCMAKNPGQ